MNTYRKLTGFSVLLLVLLVLTPNVMTLHFSTDSQNSYKVEIFRAAQKIQEQGLDHLDLCLYPSLVSITAGEGKDF